MSSEVDTSNLMYLPYYMPDVSFNKVKYSNNLLKNGSILITDPVDGIIDINQKFLGQFKNDYIYQPNIQSTTWNIGFAQNNNNNIIYFNGITNNISQSTKLNQNSIQNFNYNTIFGLTQGDQSVIDWNYFGQNGISLTDAIYSKLGPKLFYYNGGNYTTGDFILPDNLQTVGTPSSSLLNSSYLSILEGKTIYPVDPSLQSLSIDSTTQIKNINNIWPYKVQPKETQYYSILTNGTNEALLTLPTVELNTPTQYLLTTKFNTTTMRNEYSYTDLGDIIQNNYHYIVSYFDTRPTRSNKNNIVFNSLISSVFNENLVQFMPLSHFTPTLCSTMHYIPTASQYASCLPIAWTTTQPHTFPYTTEKSLGLLSPIRLEWGKNITTTTEINYTCANMTNLSNILSGWNYYDNTWSSKNQLGQNVSRANVPYINAGLVIYVPNTNYNGYDQLYEGTLAVTSNPTQLPKAMIYINLNNEIPVNYYVNIAGQIINLDIPLESTQKYLPKVNKVYVNSPTYCICYSQSVDINGIFYNLTFVNDQPVSNDYKNVTIFNESSMINDYFKVYITLSKTVSKNISYTYSNNTYNFIFNIGNTTFTKSIQITSGASSNLGTVTVGMYNYDVKIDGITSGQSGNCTATITCQNVIGSNTQVNIPVDVISAGNDVSVNDFYSQATDGTKNININNNITYKQYFIESSGEGLYVTTLNNISDIIVRVDEPNNNYKLSFDNNNYYNYNITITKDNSGNVPVYSGNLNYFGNFKKWISSFLGQSPFWREDSILPESAKTYLNAIYTYPTDPQPTDDLLKYQYNFSTPCCLPFDVVATSKTVQNYNNNLISSNVNGTEIGNTGCYINSNYNFLGLTNTKGEIVTDRDLVKLVNVFSVPITNALNTTHTATDTMTFRFEKPTLDGVTDYYYIIGIYMYITKGLPVDTLQSYPHYIGFSPSTNILNPSTLQGSGVGGGVPDFLDGSFIKNTTDLYENTYTNSILMKDYLTTPSIFMSINESTGNNL